MADQGRPPIILDWKKIDSLLTAGCSGREIAGNIGIHPTTLYDHCIKDKGESFTEYSLRFYGKGESLLRATQFEKAINNKDNMMLIWLGKNRLGQKDSSDFKMESSLTVTTINYSDANNSTLQVPAETIPTANPSSSG